MKLLVILCLTYTILAVINDGPNFCQDSDREAAIATICPAICYTPQLVKVDSYGNPSLACSACAICTGDTFAYYKTYLCSDDCGNDDIPVCGYRSRGNGQLKQYRNECSACKDKNLKLFFHGFCP